MLLPRDRPDCVHKNTHRAAERNVASFRLGNVVWKLYAGCRRAQAETEYY